MTEGEINNFYKRVIELLNSERDNKISVIDSLLANCNEEEKRKILNNFSNGEVLSGQIPLHIATAKGDEFLVRHLINLGANIGARNDSGENALHIAAYRDMVNIIYFLVQECGINVNSEREPSYLDSVAENVLETPLYCAIYNNSSNAVTTLIELGANIHLLSIDLLQSAINGMEDEEQKGLATRLLAPLYQYSTLLKETYFSSDLDLDTKIKDIKNLIEKTSVETGLEERVLVNLPLDQHGNSLMHLAIIRVIANLKDNTRDLGQKRQIQLQQLHLLEYLVFLGSEINSLNSDQLNPLELARGIRLFDEQSDLENVLVGFVKKYGNKENFKRIIEDEVEEFVGARDMADIVNEFLLYNNDQFRSQENLNSEEEVTSTEEKQSKNENNISINRVSVAVPEGAWAVYDEHHVSSGLNSQSASFSLSPESTSRPITISAKVSERLDEVRLEKNRNR